MIKVLPIQTKEEQENICRICGVEFDIHTLAYAATVDDELRGICQFALTEKGGVIRSIACIGEKDFEILFLLGRASLNFIDLNGVHSAYFEDPCFTDEDIIKAIGFELTADGKYFVDLTDFFTAPCKHHPMKTPDFSDK